MSGITHHASSSSLAAARRRLERVKGCYAAACRNREAYCFWLLGQRQSRGYYQRVRCSLHDRNVALGSVPTEAHENRLRQYEASRALPQKKEESLLSNPS